MKLYIAGPMTWHPQYNYPAFDEMAAWLREQGYEVISPSELDNEQDRAAALDSLDGDPATYGGDSTWGDFLSRDVKLIADIGLDGIVVLPGWHKSRGARLETFVGGALGGLPILRRVQLMDREFVLDEVPELDLFRAWTGDPTLQARRRVYA